MTISKIYIAAFGGLKDHTLELDRGFNVILGENENGKSTIMAFLKMMFYGSGRRSNDLNKNPRLKYKPWSGDTMGGRVYFEHGGRRYCLEREFRNNDSADRIALRDLDHGSSIPVASADIGKRFFGMSDAAFERSIFIGGTGAFAADPNASSELNARLSNTAVTGDEDTSYQLIAERIHAALGELKTAKHVGKYDKGIARLEELRNEYTKADTAAKAREELSEKIKLLKKQLTDTKADYDRVKSIVDSENDIRSAEKIREYLEVKKQLDELNKTLLLGDGGQIDTVFIGKVNFCLSKYDTECRRESEKQTELTELENSLRIAEQSRDSATPQKLEELRSQAEKLQNERSTLSAKYNAEKEKLNAAEKAHELSLTKRRLFNPILLIAGLVLIAGGVTAFALKQPIPAIAATIAGVVLTSLGFVIRPLDKAAIIKAEGAVAALQRTLTDIKAQETDIQGRMNTLAGEISLMTAALNTDKALLDQKKTDLAERACQLAKIGEQKTAALSELISLFSRFETVDDPEQIRSCLVGLTARTEEQKNIKLRLKYLSSDLGNISYETAAEKLAEIENKKPAREIDFEKARIELEALNERGVELSTALSSAMTELKNELRHAVDPENIQREIAELSAKLEDQKKFFDAASLAAEVLKDSYAEVHSGYGSALEKRTLEIFSQLTGGRYSSMNVSDTMQLETEATGSFGTRSIEYLSSGTVDQAYLSLRLAVCELMSEDGERLPVMLDDALSQYDDTRAKTALAFLKEYSQDTQIVLFTCHNSIYQAGEDIGAVTQAFKK